MRTRLGPRNRLRGGVLVLLIASHLIPGCARGLRGTGPAAPKQPPVNTAFDPPAADQQWRVGDVVIYEFTLCDGKAVQRSYVRFSVLAQPEEEWPKNLQPETSLAVELRVGKNAARSVERKLSNVLAKVERLNERGEVEATGELGLPVEALSAGVYAPLRGLLRAGGDEAATTPDDLWQAFLRVAQTQHGCQVLFAQSQVRPILRDLLIEVIRPNVLQLLRLRQSSFIAIWDDKSRCELTEVQLGENRVEAVSFPVEWRLRDDVLSVARVTAVAPVAPFHLCGGIVEIAGTDVDDNRRWYRIRLVSARRGTRTSTSAPAADPPVPPASHATGGAVK